MIIDSPMAVEVLLIRIVFESVILLKANGVTVSIEVHRSALSSMIEGRFIAM